MFEKWDQRLKEQASRDFKTPVIVDIDLSVARTNELKAIPGDLLYVNTVSSKSAAATVRLNRDTNEAITLSHKKKIETVFTRFYITNTAQAGESLQIIVGIDFDIEDLIEKAEAQSVIIITHANPNTSQAGAEHLCNAAIIKADVKNTGIVWIDFGKAAVQDSCFPLDPAEWIKVPISNTNKININLEVGGEKVFVIYEV